MLGIAVAIFNGLGYIGHEFMNNINDDQERRLSLAIGNDSDPNAPITYIDSHGRMRDSKTNKQVSYIVNANGDMCLVNTKTGHFIYNYDEVKRKNEMQKNKELAIQEEEMFYSYRLHNHEYFKKIDNDEKLYNKEMIQIIRMGFPVYGYYVYVDISTGDVDFSATDINRAKERYVSDSRRYMKSKEEALKVFNSETDKWIAKFKELYPRRY